MSIADTAETTDTAIKVPVVRTSHKFNQHAGRPQEGCGMCADEKAKKEARAS